MKREIKFRAWDKDKSKMLAPFSVRKLINGFNTEGNWSDYEDDELLDINYEGSDEYELMQYTGLKDKNGKKIYESDILRWMDDSNLVQGNVQVVKFENYQIYPLVIAPTSAAWEIIGNIYENPELLTKSI